MFEGTFYHQLDAKNRMRIPAKLREELGGSFTITCSTEGCLLVYSREGMDKLMHDLEKISIFNTSAQRAVRFIVANTWTAEEDAQGRILLPEKLREAAKIVKDVVVIRNVTCVEIWGAEAWQEYQKNADFNDIASALEKINAEK